MVAGAGVRPSVLELGDGEGDTERSVGRMTPWIVFTELYESLSPNAAATNQSLYPGKERKRRSRSYMPSERMKPRMEERRRGEGMREGWMYVGKFEVLEGRGVGVVDRLVGGGGERNMDISICVEQLCPIKYNLPGSYLDGGSGPGQSSMNLRNSWRSSACAGCRMCRVEKVVRR